MKVREESQLDFSVRVLSHLRPRGEKEAAGDPLAKLQSEESQDQLPAELGLFSQGIDDPLLDDDDVEVEKSLHREDREASQDDELHFGGFPGPQVGRQRPQTPAESAPRRAGVLEHPGAPLASPEDRELLLVPRIIARCPIIVVLHSKQCRHACEGDRERGEPQAQLSHSNAGEQVIGLAQVDGEEEDGHGGKCYEEPHDAENHNQPRKYS